MRVTLRMEPDAERPEWKTGASQFDLRGDPGAIEQIEPARLHRPLRGFLSALNSEETIYATVACRTSVKTEAGGEAEFASSVDVVFATQRQNFDRKRFESLASSLRDLLEKEPGGEHLAVEICILDCSSRDSRNPNYALQLILFARGNSPAQAELRWGLAVAHLQQAMLYLSRTLRQQQARSN
jgi:hypothetical protein